MPIRRFAVTNGTQGGGNSGMTEAEVGRVLGLTRGGVWVIERRIIRKLWREHRRLSLIADGRMNRLMTEIPEELQ